MCPHETVSVASSYNVEDTAVLTSETVVSEFK